MSRERAAAAASFRLGGPPQLARSARMPLTSNPAAAVSLETMNSETLMYLVREIMYCKPGKVRAMVDKFTAMSKLSEKVGMPKMRIMTDMCAERYWTIVSEMEVPSLEAFDNMMRNPQSSPEDMKKLEKIMDGYHDLVDHGKREIYKIEA